MRKLILFIILPILLISSSVETEKEIYNIILKALFPSKSIVKVWSDESSKNSLFKSIDGVHIVKNKKEADILMLFNTYDTQERHQAIFANGYLVFQRNKGNAIGGFYWQKGRPNLIFVKNKLQKRGIVLPEKLQKYIEDIE